MPGYGEVSKQKQVLARRTWVAERVSELNGLIITYLVDQTDFVHPWVRQDRPTFVVLKTVRTCPALELGSC